MVGGEWTWIDLAGNSTAVRADIGVFGWAMGLVEVGDRVGGVGLRQGEVFKDHNESMTLAPLQKQMLPPMRQLGVDRTRQASGAIPPTSDADRKSFGRHGMRGPTFQA